MYNKQQQLKPLNHKKANEIHPLSSQTKNIAKILLTPKQPTIKNTTNPPSKPVKLQK